MFFVCLTFQNLTSHFRFSSTFTIGRRINLFSNFMLNITLSPKVITASCAFCYIWLKNQFWTWFFSPITQSQVRHVDAALAKAAKRLDATNTQIILSWVKTKGVVIVTLVSEPLLKWRINSNSNFLVCFIEEFLRSDIVYWNILMRATSVSELQNFRKASHTDIIIIFQQISPLRKSLI